MKKLILSSILLCTHLFSPLHARLAMGDPSAAPGDTFSFTVGFASFDFGGEKSGARLWLATDDPTINTLPLSTQIYGLSYIPLQASYTLPNTTLQAVPMTTTGDATIYTVDSSNKITTTTIPNPILGSQFAYFGVVAQRPAFVLENSLNSVYYVQNITFPSITAENTEQSTTLSNYLFDSGEQIHAFITTLFGIYLAHATGDFGSNPSKISLLMAPGGTTSALLLTAEASISTSTPALVGGESQPPLTALGPTVALGYAFNQLFVGVQATADSCAIAATLAGMTSNSFQFIQLLSTSIAQAVSTPISATAGNSLTITHIDGVKTSTGLDYLIIARNDTGSSPIVYALPIIGSGPGVGLIADFTSIQTLFNTKPPLFSQRGFTITVTDESQVDLSGSFANQLTVGGEAPLGTSIKKLYTLGDSVYVVIADQYASTTHAPGTWRSQAIFAADGHILGWTPWTRVLGSDNQMIYSSLSARSLVGFYIDAQTSSATPQFRSVNETSFVNNSNLAPFLTNAQNVVGGIQGLFNFGSYTAGFNNALSMLIATGYGQVTIGQTGTINGGSFTIQTMTPSDVITFTPNDLFNSHALVAAEIASDGINHWLFVGGVDGLLVLTDDTSGVTWSGNLTDVSALNATQTWKQVGNFQFIKKLVYDNNYLYVLTSTQLTRIALNPANFTATPSPLNQQVVLSASNLNNSLYLLDVIIDHGFCLIGTTNGLYASSSSGNNFQQISIPDGLSAVTQIISISSQSDAQHSFATLSNLYIVTSSFGTQQARVNRFSIEGGIITPFNDSLIAQPQSTSQGVLSSFVTFDNYISNYFTDGTWNIATSYNVGPGQPFGTQPTPFLQQLFSGIKVGQSSSHVIMPLLSHYIPLPFLTYNTNLLGIVRESTSGTIILAGSFEAQANA